MRQKLLYYGLFYLAGIVFQHFPAQAIILGIFILGYIKLANSPALRINKRQGLSLLFCFLFGLVFSAISQDAQARRIGCYF